MKTKTLFFTTILALATTFGFATVLTVSNHALGGSQYNDLQSAYDAAEDGDTLIMEGTNVNYIWNRTVDWDKSLTVIGAGFNANKPLFRKTFIESSHTSYRIQIGSNGSGSSFYGIVYKTGIGQAGATNDLTFEDCEFQEYFNTGNEITTNLIFRNCIFNDNNGYNMILGNGAAIAVLVSNCVFDGYIHGNNSLENILVVDHCLFLRSGSTGAFYDVKNASISNSIFMNTIPDGTSSCQYMNNICRVEGTFPPEGNSGSNNISNTDPMLVDYTFDQYYNNSHDYALQPGSPCIGTGVGGVDIGVHGGTSMFSEYGEPLIAPVVRYIQINNTTVLPNGTLEVNVSASKPEVD